MPLNDDDDDEVQTSIGSQACNQIVVAHALGGCDTVSAVFGHGKTSTYKKLINTSSSYFHSSVLMDKDASKDAVIKSGLEC